MKVSVFVAILIVLVALLIMFMNPAKEYEELPTSALRDSSYNVKKLVVPTLSGFLFQVMLFWVETPLINRIILAKMYRDSNFFHVRQFASLLDEVQTFYPLVHAEGEKESVLTTKDRVKLIESAVEVFPAVDFTGQPQRFFTINDYAEAYRQNKTTPLEVAKRLLKIIEESNQHQPPLRAFFQVHETDILEQATRSTKRFKEGKPLSILDGVLVPVKDEVDVAGYVTYVGTVMVQKNAERDAFIISELKKLGAIIFGKTTMHEIGIGVSGHNQHWGLVRNAYNLSHYPGGSSSGSGVSVGTGMAPFAVAADGGGSVRIPASYAGAIGLKSTFGRVSETGAFPLCPTLGHLGPIAATVRDTAIAYAAIAGPDPNDDNSEFQPPIAFRKVELRDMKIGIFTPWIEDAHPEIIAKSKQTLQLLKKEGATVIEIPIPNLEAITKAHIITIVTEMSTALTQYIKNSPTLFGDDVRLKLALSTYFDSKDYSCAQKIRTYALEVFEQIFSKVDLIFTPATGIPSPRIPEEAIISGHPIENTQELSAILRFASFANFVGIPAITVPVGYTKDNLPISVQFAASHWQENLLLNVASFVESHTVHQKPEYFKSPLLTEK